MLRESLLFRIIYTFIIVCILMQFGFFLLKIDQDMLAGIYFFMAGYSWALFEKNLFEK